VLKGVCRKTGHRGHITTTPCTPAHSASATCCLRRPRRCSSTASPLSTSGGRFADRCRKSPLAVCDAQSLRQDDFVASDLIYPHRRDETYAVTFPRSPRVFMLPIRCHRAMTEVFPLERAAEAYEHMMSGKARFRAVLTTGH
jgi:hypothetical protein